MVVDSSPLSHVVASVRQNACYNYGYPVNPNYPADAVLNTMIMHGEMLDLFCLSSPGDYVLDIQNGNYTLDRWLDNREERDSQRQSYLDRFSSFYVCCISRSESWKLR